MQPMIGCMAHTPPYPDEPVTVSIAARRLRVPVQWLRDEAEAGRLPHLKAGRAMLMHVPTVAAILRDRARGEGGGDE